MPSSRCFGLPTLPLDCIVPLTGLLLGLPYLNFSLNKFFVVFVAQIRYNHRFWVHRLADASEAGSGDRLVVYLHVGCVATAALNFFESGWFSVCVFAHDKNFGNIGSVSDLNASL